MIIDTLTTKDLLALQRDVKKEIQARQVTVNFITFYNSGRSSCGTRDYVCEDNPISLIAWFDAFFQKQRSKPKGPPLHYAPNYRDYYERWRRGSNGPFYFYRIKNVKQNAPVFRADPDDLQRCKPTDVLKGGHYWVTTADCIPVLKERRAMRKERLARPSK